MEGVIAACVAFIFVCAIFPKLVRNAQQFYAALGIIVISVLLIGLARMIQHGGFINVIQGITTMGIAAAVLLLFLSAGGITWGGLAGEMKGAIEVMRRGETEKEIRFSKEQVASEIAAARAAKEAQSNAANQPAPPSATPAQAPPPRRTDTPIPLE